MAETPLEDIRYDVADHVAPATFARPHRRTAHRARTTPEFPPARFGFVFTRRGISPEGCSSWFLPRVVGIGTASEWMLTGRIVDAAEAHRAGLVQAVHAPAELLPAAYALAREISDNAAPVSA